MLDFDYLFGVFQYCKCKLTDFLMQSGSWKLNYDTGITGGFPRFLRSAIG